MKNDFQQTEKSQSKNTEFFLNHIDAYSANVGAIDTYHRIADALSAELKGIESLLDIGNGGVFDYDTSVVGRITGVDLFLDQLPPDIRFPANVTMERGDALGIPKADESFDGVVMVMLLHHLIGNSVAQCVANLERAVSEAYRVLRPGGKLVVVESCVPEWFYWFERMAFPLAVPLINRFFVHPPAFQHTIHGIGRALKERFGVQARIAQIPKGKYVLQLGVKVPSALTPVQPYLISIRKA